jgi:chromosome partitioning protein
MRACHEIACQANARMGCDSRLPYRQNIVHVAARTEASVKVYGVVSRKGGSAKSLSARSFAVQAAIDGQRAAIIDLDPQQTCMLWAKRRPHLAPSVESVADRNIDAALTALKGRGAQIVLLDTPPHNQPLINLAVQASTGCIITTGTGPEDVEQVGPIVEIVRAFGRPAAILLCRTQPRTSTLSLARAALSTFGVPICPVAITQSVAHVYAAAEGLTASEREPKSKPAAEIEEAWRWIERTMASGTSAGELSDLGAVRARKA